MIKNKKILIGVTGSIAAYKTAMLIRQLVKQEAEVKVIMTSAAKDFITPITLSTLSKNPVLSEFVKEESGAWNNHVELGLWADLMVIAPLSANTLAKMAWGICDNLLLATYLSARCPVMVAPAMDLDMYQHPSTNANLKKLRKDGVSVIESGFGELASGLVGQGRMEEPEYIVEVINSYFQDRERLKGKKVLVNAGPTYETIDPVRFISNHSSGKMGYALAEKFAWMGAEVTLVSGPAKIDIKDPSIRLEKVSSAEEMNQACLKVFPSVDIGVLAAAVADYTPIEKSTQKIKKQSDTLTIKLKKIPDIALNLGKMKKEKQLLVGFALETQNEIENAFKKLEAKNFDLIVLNSLNDQGAGFGFDTNKISILNKENNIKEFELKDKVSVAHDIIKEILSQLPA